MGKKMTSKENIPLCCNKAKEIKKLVGEQAEDEGLWFCAETAPEAYLQHQLRTLHFLIEKCFGETEPKSLTNLKRSWNEALNTTEQNRQKD